MKNQNSFDPRRAHAFNSAMKQDVWNFNIVIVVVFVALTVSGCDQQPHEEKTSSNSSTPAPTLSSDSARGITTPVAVNVTGHSKPTPPNRRFHFASVSEAQREAIKRYPDLGIAGSRLNTEFLALNKRYSQEAPEYFSDTSWPVSLALEAYKAVCSTVSVAKVGDIYDCFVRLELPLPPSDDVDIILRDALEETISQHPNSDILANAGTGKEGKVLRSNSLPGPFQYSGSLIYRAATKKIETEAEIDYTQGKRVMSVQRHGYLVEIDRNRGAAGNSWIFLYLIFSRAPMLDQAEAAMITEIESIPERNLDISVFTMIGDERIRSSWVHVPDPDGGLFGANYLPSERTIITGNFNHPRKEITLP